MVSSISIPPIPKNNQLPKPKNSFVNRKKVPTSIQELGLGWFFGGWNGTIILLARRTRVIPGEWTHRMSKKPASSTSRMYAQGTAAARRNQARMADGLRHTKLLSHQRRGQCGEAIPTRGRREGRQSHASRGWQGADATSMTPPRALSTTAAC